MVMATVSVSLVQAQAARHDRAKTGISSRIPALVHATMPIPDTTSILRTMWNWKSWESRYTENSWKIFCRNWHTRRQHTLHAVPCHGEPHFLGQSSLTGPACFWAFLRIPEFHFHCWEWFTRFYHHWEQQRAYLFYTLCLLSLSTLHPMARLLRKIKG